jgi:hypothetical protein
MKHPSIETLALFAGGELPFLQKWSTGRHVHGCESCQSEVRAFHEASRAAAHETEIMPDGVHWESMAADMRANIHLGLEASEAISAYKPVAPPSMPSFSWHTVALGGAVACVAMFLYWNAALRKQEQLAAMRAPAPIVVNASKEGVEISDGARGLSLTNPESSQSGVLVTVSTSGAAATRYVDQDSGQITVNNVYLD